MLGKNPIIFRQIRKTAQKKQENTIEKERVKSRGIKKKKGNQNISAINSKGKYIVNTDKETVMNQIE